MGVMYLDPFGPAISAPRQSPPIVLVDSVGTTVQVPKWNPPTIVSESQGAGEMGSW